MTWRRHPRFKRACDEVLGALAAKEYHFRKVTRIAFLCGGNGSLPRQRVASYLRAHRQDYAVFYAESVWELISDLAGSNALAVEDELARLADVVIIIVESPGTFAELGAFSLSTHLRSKLLPILPAQHKGEQSFIASGPVKWIDTDSHFAPSIWIPHENILDAAAELEERLDRLDAIAPITLDDFTHSPKHLLFFLCDLVAIFGPAPMEDFEFYARHLLGQMPSPSVPTLLGLASAMGLTSTTPDSRYYYRNLDKGSLNSFQYKRKYVDPGSLRARLLSAMQLIPEAAAALNAMANAGRNTDVVR